MWEQEPDPYGVLPGSGDVGSSADRSMDADGAALPRKYYVDDGEVVLPDILQIPPISGWGNVIEISDRLGGAEPMRQAVAEMQRRLYAA